MDKKGLGLQLDEWHLNITVLNENCNLTNHNLYNGAVNDRSAENPVAWNWNKKLERTNGVGLRTGGTSYLAPID